jgi:hypothetical protein
MDGEITLSDSKDMLNYTLSFYKKMFGKESKSELILGYEFWEDDDKLSRVENEMLEVEFSEEKILVAIKGSYAERLQVLMTSPFVLSEVWGIIKKDFMALVRGFEKGMLI